MSRIVKEILGLIISKLTRQRTVTETLATVQGPCAICDAAHPSAFVPLDRNVNGIKADCFCTSHVLQLHCMIDISDGLCGIFRLDYSCIRISTYNAAIVPGHQAVKYMLYPFTILWPLRPVEIRLDGNLKGQIWQCTELVAHMMFPWPFVSFGSLYLQEPWSGSCSSSHCSRWLV